MAKGTSTHHRPAAWSLLVLYLALVAAAPQGWVLCIEADATWSLESGWGGRCAGGSPPEAPGSASGERGPDWLLGAGHGLHCGPCTDLSFGPAPPVLPRPEAAGLSLPIPGPDRVPSPEPIPQPREPHPGSDRPSARPALQFRETVALRV